MLKNKSPKSKPIVIFIASSTPEKVFNLKRIAEAKGAPIIFEDSNKLLGAFNHAEEINGNYKDNAKDKLGTIDIQGFRDGANNDDEKAADDYSKRYKKVNGREATNKEVAGYIDQVKNYRKRINNYLKDRELPKSTRMFFASEDGGFALPQELWDHIRKYHSDGIPKEALDKIAPDSKDSRFTGPGSETAPVLSGVLGEHWFMERVRKAIEELNKAGHNFPVLQNSVMLMEEFSAGSTHERMPFTANKTTNLFFPDKDLMKNIFEGNSKKISTYDYTKPNAASTESIIERGEEGILKNGVRGLLIDQIYDKLFETSPEAKSQLDYKRPYNYKHPHKDIINKKHIYRIGAFGTGDASKLAEAITDIKKKLGYGFSPSIPHGSYIGKKYGNTTQQTLAGSSYDILSNIEKTLANSDSVILFPDLKGDDHTGHDKEKLAELIKIYTLSSLVVDKQLNARDANKPVIIMNHDGSWNNAVAIHTNLSNIGMTKDYGIYIPNEIATKQGIQIQSNSYFDVLSTNGGISDSYEKTTAAVVELLKEKRKGYNPRQPSQSPHKESGVPPKKSTYKVALFCSASSENTYLNESVKNLSYDLVKSGSGIIYGGGDRYTMGAVLEGVNEHRLELVTGSRTPAYKGTVKEQAEQRQHDITRGKALNQDYIAGYSTRQILKSETKYAAFSPHLNYAKQNENIYERMADMLNNSDVVVAAPGGAGTVQEWTAALMLNHYRSKEEQKPVIFFNPKLNKEQTQVWNVALKAVLGDKDYETLTNEADVKKREQRSKELGIYVETTEKKIIERISGLKKEYDEHKADKARYESQKPQLNYGFVDLINRVQKPTSTIMQV